ncbi:MAG: hypothetical protein E1N59_2509 [Puniceicoccaceae bacterium 5H]|nr:MAG: hypothetical protein E1N59_2509 [Puniceicoccaceae bacterium 5H]
MATEQWFWRVFGAVGTALMGVMPVGGVQALLALSRAWQELQERDVPNKIELISLYLAPSLETIRVGLWLWHLGLLLLIVSLGLLRRRFPRRLHLGRCSGLRYGFTFTLCLLLGQVGAHRFYAGRWGTGMLYIVLSALTILAFRWPHPASLFISATCMPLLLLWRTVDMISIADERFRDAEGGYIMMRANRPMVPAPAIPSF